MKRSKLNKISKKDLPRLKRKLEALQREVCLIKYKKDCYTCTQKNLRGVNCQMGHVPWPKSILGGWRYDLRFVRWQCYDCNINKGGMGAVALKNMLDEIGEDAMRQMEKDRHTFIDLDVFYVSNKIKEYEELLTNSS